MEEIARWDSPTFTEAFILWTGYGQHFMPRRGDGLVVARFGAEAASKLLPAMTSLIDEFYASDAKYTTPAGSAEMGVKAMDEFKAKHPEVAEGVLKAAAWCYTFDYK